MDNCTFGIRVPRLSKSRYTSFLDCPRLGYLRAFPALFGSLCTYDANRQALFDSGTRVGELARAYYPGGFLVDADHLHIPQAKAQTRAALARGQEVIYEAAVEHDGILVRVDILRRLDDTSFEFTEVKSSTRVDAARHIPDVAIQLYVLESAGLPVRRVQLMHLDRDYVHPGGNSYLPRDLFVGEDVTAEARAHATGVLPGTLRDIARWLSADQPPETPFRNSCRECEFYEGYCRPRCSQFPVGELGRATQAIACLEEAGIGDLREVVPGSLAYARVAGLLRTSSLQARVHRMLDAVRQGELRVDRELGESIRSLSYPVHFLDFESWNPALPVFAGTRPYEQIPFQWSDHRLLPDGSIDHAAFLHDGKDDPRARVAGALVSRFADPGSIVAYHAGFEGDRLRDLAYLVPAFGAPLLDMAGRLVDLQAILSENVYHPDFHGSFSLKSVLPALVPGCGYEDLAIQNGGSAALAYERLRQMAPGPERDELRTDMLAYCARDTWGLVEIYRRLQDWI